MFHEEKRQFRINKIFFSLIQRAIKRKEFESESHFVRVAVIKELRRLYPRGMEKAERKLTLQSLNLGDSSVEAKK